MTTLQGDSRGHPAREVGVTVDIVRYSRDGLVAFIGLDDGRVNALSHAVIDSIETALDRSGAEGARAVVIAGRPGCFSAGLDLTVIRSEPRPAVKLALAGAELAIRLLSFRMPVVFAVTGHAIGMGALLCCAADERIGADGDFKIGLNAVAGGLALPDFAVELASGRLAPRYLARAVTLADVYEPRAAIEVGFLDRTVAEESVVTEALLRAASLAGRLDSEAFHATKLALRRASLERLHAHVAEGHAWLEASGEPSRRSTPNGT
jgi:enoyl-CoA hydratase